MTITLKQDGNISRLVLDDPTRRNTLTVPMLTDMTAALKEVHSGHRTSVLELQVTSSVRGSIWMHAMPRARTPWHF